MYASAASVESSRFWFRLFFDLIEFDYYGVIGFISRNLFELVRTFGVLSAHGLQDPVLRIDDLLGKLAKSTDHPQRRCFIEFYSADSSLLIVGDCDPAFDGTNTTDATPLVFHR